MDMAHGNLVLLACFLFCRWSSAAVFQSSDFGTSLIELFSSEGCSSCPPADEWLARLRKDAGLWKEFVPVEFHVDYWNRLGWHDPFSKAAFTSRQNQYASEWGGSNVYTPAFVLNGQEWKVGALGVRQIPKREGSVVGTLTVVESKNRNFEVSFQPKTISAHQWNVTGALLGNGLVSKILSGENGGRTLSHEFVALTLETRPLTKLGEKFVANLTLASSLKVSSLSFAVWVSQDQSQRPIQAVGGDLISRSE